MSITDALGEGMQVTVIGLIIVFSVLIILMLVLMLMKNIFYKPQENAKKAAKTPVKTPAAPAVPAPAPAIQTRLDDMELVAVLTAAIAASLNTSTYHLNIKSYRRIENTSPAWNRAGVRDVIDARY